MKQAHVRFDVEKTVVVDTATARCTLMKASVRAPTRKQYDSRLRVLQKYLEHSRACPVEQIVSCTEDEFISFLYNWLLQKKASAEGVRSALLQEHRKHGIVSFLGKADVKKMVRGAGSSGEQRQKGVLEGDRVEVLKDLMRSDWGRMALACNTCEKVLAWSSICDALCHALDLMVTAPIRPGNLKDFLVEHLSQDATGWQLWIAHLKTAKHGERGGAIEVDLAAALIFRAAEEDAVRGFLFPRCAQKHLGVALRKAQEIYGWEDDLVFTPHCLRNTMMVGKKQKVEKAVGALMCGVTAPTFMGYTKPRGK